MDSPFPGMDPYLEHPSLWPDVHNSLAAAIRDALSSEVSESYLELREVHTGILVTVVELLSPANKLHAEGRRRYEAKRLRLLGTLTNLVEIDLLRAGEPMPVSGSRSPADYRILISRGAERPRSLLYALGLREPLPTIPIPLLPGDAEPMLDVGEVLHGVYRRARFDLRLDYDQPPVPPLGEADAQWAQDRVRVHAARSS